MSRTSGPVYRAESKAMAELRLNELEEKWGRKYPKVLESWRRNWEKLSTYFKYSEQIRRLIYTTNAIEGFHRQVRKVTKTKGAFPSDIALLKLIYLSHQNISRKWVMGATGDRPPSNSPIGLVRECQ